MFMIVAVNAQQLPVAAVGWIVIVIVILVVDREFPQLLAGELATATAADVGEEAESPFSVTLLSDFGFPSLVSEYLSLPLRVGRCPFGLHEEMFPQTSPACQAARLGNDRPTVCST